MEKGRLLPLIAEESLPDSTTGETSAECLSDEELAQAVKSPAQKMEKKENAFFIGFCKIENGKLPIAKKIESWRKNQEKLYLQNTMFND